MVSTFLLLPTQAHTPNPQPNNMIAIIFKGNGSKFDAMVHMLIALPSDITVELASRDECFLTDIAHLILELNHSGRSVDKVNLFSRESMPGVWDADKPLVLLGVTGEFMLSVSMQFDENDRQLVGSMELNETDFYDLVGTQYGK
ncbi:hypothetical protein CPB86DRAFT_798790 [Serendipita vermifera]|nr:hypothetical protein CPB86DRAFT_798790 [Serendipita vermifera]